MRVKRGSDGKIEGGGGGFSRHSSPPAVHPSFGTSMESALEEIEVRDFLDRLNVLTEKLSIFPAERLLMEYRAILKELLARAMRGFSLKRDLKWRRTDRSTYVTVERVESAMDELEKAFQQEGGRTRALQLMEEIKGCLISLLF